MLIRNVDVDGSLVAGEAMELAVDEAHSVLSASKGRSLGALWHAPKWQNVRVVTWTDHDALRSPTRLTI